MMLNVIYKDFDPANDWPLFYEAEYASHAATHEFPLTDELLNRRKSDILIFIKNQNYLVKTIYVNGTPAGMFIFGIVGQNSNPYGFLYNLYVKSEYRNQKIGTQVLQNCINFAKEHSVDRVMLNVGCNNHSAIHIYKKNGFKPQEMAMELVIEK